MGKSKFLLIVGKRPADTTGEERVRNIPKKKGGRGIGGMTAE